jgi:myxalamid-type polyketide synthase MxaE and MxaD
VGLAPEAVRERLAGREESLGIAGHTAPRTSIVSGEPAALDELLGELEADEVFCRLLANVDAAAHSPQMDPLIGELEELLAGLSPGPARLPFHSTVDAEELPGERLDAAYWARNLRQPFRLAEVVAELIRQGPPVFLEAGPEPVLAGAIRQSLLDLGAEGFPVASLREGDDARRSLLMGLGGLHVQGVRLDWRRLHPGESRCVALPTYPWRRRRHWLDQLPGGATGPGGRRSGAHPLLGDGVEPARPGDPRLWQTELEARSLHYLREHRVQGQVVFPGAAYLEMALAAGTAGGAPALGVEEVCFERGLLLAEGEPRRIQLVAEPSRRGEEIFEIYSRDLEADGEGPAAPDGASGAWTLHARGVLRTAGGTDGPEPLAPAGLDGLRERCAEPVPAGELYASMRARGLEHGPAFQAVRSLWRGASESLAELELDPRVASELGSYRLHPVLLDACLHGIAAALPPSGDEQDRETYLPWKIGRLRRFRPPGPRGWCHARLAPGSRPGLDTLVADVRLFDPDGQPVAELEGVSLRRLEAAAGRARRPVEDDLYRVDWVPADPPPHDGNDGPDTWLLFTDGDGVGGELADQVERAGGTAIRIRRGAGGADGGGGEGADFTLEAPTREAYERLFAEVLGAGSGPRRLVHLGSLDRPAGPDVAAELCAEVTAMLQALTGSPEAEARPSRLWLVTHGAQPVDGRPEMASPAGTALWGLGRSIAHEHPEHWGGLVELDTPQPTLAANRLRDELVREGSTGPTGSTGSTRSGREVAFFGGRRHEARLVRWRPSGPPLPVGFRRDASYLITGGLAGLGLETARWMVRRGARRLVLVGRTPLPERREWASVEEGSAAGRRIAAVRELEAMGAAVHVASVDVGDEDALGALLERHRRECLPPIRGVVHSAGVLRDRLLVRMEAGDFEAVFRPKAHAAWFLHHLTAGLELDFFLLYASVASVLGHLGQANHAAANAYLDGLAHHRRGLGLPATSIDWGPWAEIGGFAREQAEGAATASGMEPFTPARGIEALERIFESGPAQVTATDADWTAMAGLPLVADLAAAGRAPGASGPGGGAGDADGEPETSGLLELLLAPPDERRALLQEELLRATARVLRTDPARIDPAKPLTTLGMESVMAVELKNSVESRLGLTIPVVDLFSGSVAGLAEKLSAGLEEDERFADLLEELESFEAAAPEDLEVGE